MPREHPLGSHSDHTEGPCHLTDSHRTQTTTKQNDVHMWHSNHCIPSTLSQSHSNAIITLYLSQRRVVMSNTHLLGLTEAPLVDMVHSKCQRGKAGSAQQHIKGGKLHRHHLRHHLS